ncbi:coronin-2B isoform X1 [Electrophorus electricus]|nr:coronin-2B isoform X1 [Electrophorus electricus]
MKKQCYGLNISACSVSTFTKISALQMSWRSTYRSSKFRNVYGKVGQREACYEGIPITRNVHDNHFCAVNPKFLAVVTESSGGGSFLVIPIYKVGRVDPHHPKICGHQGNVLDIKWCPFRDNIIASCSEDCSVRIWEIPDGGLRRNMTEAQMVLIGHSRRVGLIEWHPTCSGILYSAGYDGKILLWNLEKGEAVKMIDSHSDVVLCMSFSRDGSLLATSCKDKKLRIIEARSGRVLQEAYSKSHRVSRVVFLGNMKHVLTTGLSRWNTRQVAVWDQEDLSVPIIEEEIDGLSGLLFPFYDADTHMLYLAGKGDGNIRYYEVSPEKPHLQYLMEFSSSAPQKGLGVMPKRGLDVGECEVFRFYKLITLKGLVEPISMIVPRKAEIFQEDIYPMTSGAEPALTTEEWLSGIDRGPVLVSLKEKYKQPKPAGPKAAKREKKALAKTMKGFDLLENVSPKSDNEFLRMFYRQQDELKQLQKELRDKDERIKHLELELNNLKNNMTLNLSISNN